MFRISLPWTASFAFDFFKSRLSISKVGCQKTCCWVNHPIRKRKKKSSTIASNIHVEDAAKLHVYHAKEPLVLLFKFFLIKYLYSDNTFVCHLSIKSIIIIIIVVSIRIKAAFKIKAWRQQSLQIKSFIPVWIQSLLHYCCRVRLLTVHSDHSCKPVPD